MSGPSRHTIPALLLALLLPSGARAAAPDSTSFAPYSLRTESILDRDALEAAGIRRPSRLAFDAEGNLHVLDAETRHVVKLDPRGRVLYDVGGYGTDEASLELPVDIAVDRDQSLLVLDRGRGALLAFDRAGRFLGQRLFQGAAADEAREPGARLLLDRLGKLWLLSAHERDLVPLDDVLEPARTSRFLVPEDSLRAPLVAASSPDGDLWVYDAGRAAVLRFDPSGRLQSTVASACVTDLAVDAAGFLYAASATSQSVSAYGSRIEGSARTLRLFGGDKISWRPAALAVGPGRRVAVADPDRDEIQMLAPEPRP